jgi:AGZA family xanthine/uracil permease-like MFS transporter
MGVLMIRKVRGAIMIGILGTTGLAFGIKAIGFDLPDVFYPTGIISPPPSIAPIAFQFRFAEVLTIGFLPILLSIFLMDFVDTIGTLIGVSARAGFLDENGNLPEIEKPMLADAIASVVGACCGTTTTGSYIESAAGIEEGGRTGFTVLVTSILFLFALFFTPILTSIPKCAYGPALIIVGILMIDSVTKINFSDMTELIPAFFTIIFMAFTYNMGIGITAGLATYPIVKLLAGRAKEVDLGTWALSAISLLFYIFYPYH